MVFQAVFNGVPWPFKILAVRATHAMMPGNKRDLALHELIQLGYIEIVIAVKIVNAAGGNHGPAPMFFLIRALRLVSPQVPFVMTQCFGFGHFFVCGCIHFENI
jgi:hypothetical protein